MTPFSIIIPAHNERAVIVRTLEALLDGLPDGVEVFVVCNGCSDGTAEAARAVGGRVRVVEIETASKTAALNEGDRVATYFPRIYMDADVRIKGRDVVTLVRYMQEHGVPAAAPKAVMQVDHASWPVRAYYRTWFALPYVKAGMVGCGVFALSKEGRSRFGEFPSITADDGFVRFHFRDDERPVVEDCPVIVTAPATLKGLLAIKTRSRYGKLELRQRFPELLNQKNANSRFRSIAGLFRSPRNWPAAFVYIAVCALVSIRARRKARSARPSHWERDDSSRTLSVINPH